MTSLAVLRDNTEVTMTSTTNGISDTRASDSSLDHSADLNNEHGVSFSMSGAHNFKLFNAILFNNHYI